MATSQDLWVYVELEGKAASRAGLELLSGARGLAGELGGQVVAVAFGPGAAEVAPSLGRFGAQEVLINNDPQLSTHGADAQADVLAQALNHRQPRAILLSAALDGLDIAGRLAAKLGSGLLANATALSVEGGKLVMQETAFDGTLLISCTT